MAKHFIRTQIPSAASLTELLCQQATQLAGRPMQACLGTDFFDVSVWDAIGNGITFGFAFSTANHSLNFGTVAGVPNEVGCFLPFDTFGTAVKHVLDASASRWMFYARARFVTATVSGGAQSQQGFGMIDALTDGTDGGNPKVYIGALGSVSTTNFVASIVDAGGSASTIDTGIPIDTEWHDFHIFNDVDDGVVRFYIDKVQVAENLSSNIPAAPMVAGGMVRTGGGVTAVRTLEIDAFYVVTESAG